LNTYCAGVRNTIRYLFICYRFNGDFTIFLVGVVDISFIRLLRWFRILRLIRFIEKKVVFGSISTEDGVIFARIFLFAIIFVYSGLIYQVEHPVNLKFSLLFGCGLLLVDDIWVWRRYPSFRGGRLITVLMILVLLLYLGNWVIWLSNWSKRPIRYRRFVLLVTYPSTMPMLSSASSAALNWKRFKRVRLPIREMGRISLPCPLLCSPALLPTLHFVDAALRYIAEFAAAVLESVWFVPGIEPTPRSAALEFAGLGKIHGSKAACLPWRLCIAALNCSRCCGVRIFSIWARVLRLTWASRSFVAG